MARTQGPLSCPPCLLDGDVSLRTQFDICTLLMSDKSDHRLLLELWLDPIKTFNSLVSHFVASLVHAYNRDHPARRHVYPPA